MHWIEFFAVSGPVSRMSLCWKPVSTTVMPAFSHSSASGTTPGSGLNCGILGAERQDLELAVGQERHAQIVQRHDLLDLVRILLGEIHRDVAAHRMPDHGQLVVVGIGLDLLHLVDGEMDVGDAALNLRQAADIEFAGLGHHRRIGRQIMLRADRQIAARRKVLARKEYSVCLTVLP